MGSVWAENHISVIFQELKLYFVLKIASPCNKVGDFVGIIPLGLGHLGLSQMLELCICNFSALYVAADYWKRKYIVGTSEFGGDEG